VASCLIFALGEGIRVSGSVVPGGATGRPCRECVGGGKDR